MASISQTGASAQSSRWLRGRVTSWVFATDHKRIGILWLLVAGIAAVMAAILARLHRSPDRDGRRLASRQRDLRVGPDDGGDAPPVLRARSPGHRSGRLSRAAHDRRAWDRAPAGSSPSHSGSPRSVGPAVVLAPFGSGDAPRSWWTTVPALATNPARGAEDGRLIGLFLLGLAVVPHGGCARRDASPACGSRDDPGRGFRSSRRALASMRPLASFSRPCFSIGTALLLLERAEPGNLGLVPHRQGPRARVGLDLRPGNRRRGSRSRAGRDG